MASSRAFCNAKQTPCKSSERGRDASQRLTRACSDRGPKARRRVGFRFSSQAVKTSCVRNMNPRFCESPFTHSLIHSPGYRGVECSAIESRPKPRSHGSSGHTVSWLSRELEARPRERAWLLGSSGPHIQTRLMGCRCLRACL